MGNGGGLHNFGNQALDRHIRSSALAGNGLTLAGVTGSDTPPSSLMAKELAEGGR
jgi:hypothetical protein